MNQPVLLRDLYLGDRFVLASDRQRKKRYVSLGRESKNIVRCRLEGTGEVFNKSSKLLVIKLPNKEEP